MKGSEAFLKVMKGSEGFLQGSVGFCRVLQGFTGFYRVQRTTLTVSRVLRTLWFASLEDFSGVYSKKRETFMNYDFLPALQLARIKNSPPPHFCNPYHNENSLFSVL